MESCAPKESDFLYCVHPTPLLLAENDQEYGGDALLEDHLWCHIQV